MDLSLELKQTQKLSPQMIQSVYILQMGIQELQEYIEKAALENPVLEIETIEKQDVESALRSKVEWLMANDRQNRCYHQEDTQDLINLVVDPGGESIYDYLLGQLNMERLSKPMQSAVNCVLTGLNANGYLEETTEELAERCHQPVEMVRQAEQIIQALEPAGVGAHTLAECLSIQLRRRGEGGLVLTLAENYLEDMAKDHYSRIAKETGVSRQEIQEACGKIRLLNPRPGAPYAPYELPEYIVPDLFVTEKDGEWVITSGDGILPGIKVSAYYRELAQNTDEKEVQDYLTNKIRQAVWIAKSVEQRRNTLMKCAGIIVNRQLPFFRQGVGHVKPLTLADVAAEAGIHESTVSRTIRNKYIQCVHGVFPMSYFFGRAISSCGDGVSSEHAKAAIRELIEREDRRRPFSDQKLCDLLTERGLTLSRRTVAKYRDEMEIASAPGRKEF